MRVSLLAMDKLTRQLGTYNQVSETFRHTFNIELVPDKILIYYPVTRRPNKNKKRKFKARPISFIRSYFVNIQSKLGRLLWHVVAMISYNEFFEDVIYFRNVNKTLLSIFAISCYLWLIKYQIKLMFGLTFFRFTFRKCCIPPLPPSPSPSHPHKNVKKKSLNGI